MPDSPAVAALRVRVRVRAARRAWLAEQRAARQVRMVAQTVRRVFEPPAVLPRTRRAIERLRAAGRLEPCPS